MVGQLIQAKSIDDIIYPGPANCKVEIIGFVWNQSASYDAGNTYLAVPKGGLVYLLISDSGIEEEVSFFLRTNMNKSHAIAVQGNVKGNSKRKYVEVTGAKNTVHATNAYQIMTQHHDEETKRTLTLENMNLDNSEQNAIRASMIYADLVQKDASKLLGITPRVLNYKLKFVFPNIYEEFYQQPATSNGNP